MYGGNDASTTQARLYFTDSSLNINADNQVTVAKAAERLGNIVSDILTGTTINKATGNTSNQVSTGSNASNSEGSEASTNTQIIEDAVTNGVLPGSPTTTKCYMELYCIPRC